MNDVLHILALLKRQAESSLAIATRHKQDAFSNIKKIKQNIIEMGRDLEAQSQGMVYEQWCIHQRRSLAQIEASIPDLDHEILCAFKNLEKVQAKLTAAEGIAVKQKREADIKAEGIEEDAMLELSLLRLAVNKRDHSIK